MNKKGHLLVLSGWPGAGKDLISDLFISHPVNSNYFSFQKVVSFTDRPPRPNEIRGVHHHFVSPHELDKLHRENKLIEKPVQTGNSRKATPKEVFEDLLAEKVNLLWRVDPSLTQKIITKNFFSQTFEPKTAGVLETKTITVMIEASRNELQKRYMSRDNKANLPEFLNRLEYEEKILKPHLDKFDYRLLNENKSPQETTQELIDKVSNYFGFKDLKLIQY